MSKTAYDPDKLNDEEYLRVFGTPRQYKRKGDARKCRRKKKTKSRKEMLMEEVRGMSDADLKEMLRILQS